MNRARNANSKINRCRAARRPCGTTSFELLVAFTLLITAVSTAMPLMVRHGRLLTAQRDYRLALDELSNQLDRIGALPPAEVPAAAQGATASPFLLERIPTAKLTGRTEPAAGGTRVTLSLSWGAKGRERSPISLSTWVFPAKLASAGGAAAEEQKP
jgi:hypothetical protein